MAIIKDTDYLDTVQGVVDSDEYTEMIQRIKKIVTDAVSYVEDYVAYKNNADNHISEQEFLRRYKFSTLPYFHDILGID